MKIKQKQTDKQKFGWWLRRFKGYSSITLKSGQSIKFKTNELYSLARENISKRVFPNILDLVKFAKSLPTGFEVGVTTVAMSEPIIFNNMFIPAPKNSIEWDD